MPGKLAYFLLQKFLDGITRYFLVNNIGSALVKNIGAAGGAVKKVVSTITSGVGTLIGGAAKAIGGMISMFASLFGW